MGLSEALRAMTGLSVKSDFFVYQRLKVLRGKGA